MVTRRKRRRLRQRRRKRTHKRRRKKTRKRKYRGGVKKGDFLLATKNLRLPLTKKGSMWMVSNIRGNYIEAMHIGGGDSIASNKTSFFHKDLMDHGLSILVGDERNTSGGGGGGGSAVPARSKRKTKKVHWSTAPPRRFFFVPHAMTVEQYNAFKQSQLSKKMTSEQIRMRKKAEREDEERERKLPPGYLDPNTSPCKGDTAQRLIDCRQRYKDLAADASAAAAAVAESVNDNVAELYNDFQPAGRTEKVCLEVYHNCRAHIRAIKKMVANQNEGI